MAVWNYILVTAANASQAEAFRRRLRLKQQNGSVPTQTKCIVIPDGTRSAGSGTAVLRAVQRLYHEENCTRFPTGLRVLLINCGGESRRVPQYSVCGKLFAPSIVGEEGDLFDDIVSSFAHIPAQTDGGLLISTSDIAADLQGFGQPLSGNTAFAVPGTVQQGTRHGVFLTDPDRSVRSFLHKQPASVLAQSGAVRADGSVGIDTGILFFTPACTDALRAVADRLSGLPDADRLDLYGDIVCLFSRDCTLEAYTAQVPAHSLQARKVLFDALRDERMTCVTLHGTEFLHVGTTREMLRLRTGDNPAAVLRDSIVDPGAVIGSGCYIENSVIGAGTVIGNNCVVSNAQTEDLTISDDTALYCAKLRDGRFAACMYPVDENCQAQPDLWEQARFAADASCSRAVKATAAGVGCRYSFRTVTENADPFYPIEREESLHKTILLHKYETFRQRIIEAEKQRIRSEPPFRIRKESASVRMPVRINFAGTWTDASPYCILYGGSVVNAAVLLNHDFPIRAGVRVLPDDAFVLRCEDRNLAASFRSVEQLTRIDDPDDPFLIHKAALIACGVIPFDGDAQQRSARDRIGCGLELSICARDIPMGSGLGTSSLLLCALMRALYAVAGETADEETIIRKVFFAEQLIHCGGGWQDQSGGLYPGIKRSFSAGGTEQRVAFERIQCPESFLSFLNERSCLIYTGERIFGRTIVEEIMCRCIGKTPKVMRALHAMKQLSADMQKAMEAGDEAAFAGLVNRHTALLCDLSDKIVTPKMRGIMNVSADWVAASTVCGAGGGGYMYALLREDAKKDALERALRSAFGGTVRLADCTIAPDNV